MCIRDRAAALPDAPSPHEAMEAHVMGPIVASRYGVPSDGLVSCMMTCHNLEADFATCAAQYLECGGPANASLSTEHIEDLLADAAAAARSDNRSVGDHAPCSEMFDESMISAVMELESDFVDTYQLGQCCS